MFRRGRASKASGMWQSHGSDRGTLFAGTPWPEKGAGDQLLVALHHPHHCIAAVDSAFISLNSHDPCTVNGRLKKPKIPAETLSLSRPYCCDPGPACCHSTCSCLVLPSKCMSLLAISLVILCSCGSAALNHITINSVGPYSNKFFRAYYYAKRKQNKNTKL